MLYYVIFNKPVTKFFIYSSRARMLFFFQNIDKYCFYFIHYFIDVDADNIKTYLLINIVENSLSL